MDILIAWLVAVMVAFSPLKTAEHHRNPDARETSAERLVRYEGIARAVATVSFDPEERPLFAGPLGRHMTATALLGIAWKEGSWQRDVDLGIGPKARGGGADSCAMQIRLVSWKDAKTGEVEDARTKEGWTWRDLVEDREKCFRAGLRLVRRSFGACRAFPAEHALAAYARGRCEDPIGQQKSAERIAVGRTLLGLKPLPPAPAVTNASAP